MCISHLSDFTFNPTEYLIAVGGVIRQDPVKMIRAVQHVQNMQNFKFFKQKNLKFKLNHYDKQTNRY